VETDVAPFGSWPIVCDNITIAFRTDERPSCIACWSGLLTAAAGGWGLLTLLLTALRALLTLLGLVGGGNGFRGNEMKQGFFEQVSGNDQRVSFVPCKFDVAIKRSPVGGAHANVAANPRREKQEASVEQVPLRGPRKRDVIHTERLDLCGQPSKNTDDENHGEHHRFHGSHLDLKLLRHHLLLERHRLFLENWVPREAGFVHHLPHLALAVTDVGLVHRVNEEVPDDRVQGHGKDAENHHGNDKKRLLGQNRRENGVCCISQRGTNGGRHDEERHHDHEQEHHPHRAVGRRGRGRRWAVSHDSKRWKVGHEG